MSNKLQAKDLINLGLFTVLYFVIGCCVAIPIGFGAYLFANPRCLVVFDYRYPLHAVSDKSKEIRHGYDYGILSGLLMGLTGMGFWGVPMGLIFGLLGDLILKSGGYKSAKKSLVGMRYSVFGWSVHTFPCISW